MRVSLSWYPLTSLYGALLAVSVRDRTFRPELITGLSELFEVSPTTIYSDLRHLEPELGRLLLNKPNAPVGGGEREIDS